MTSKKETTYIVASLSDTQTSPIKVVGKDSQAAVIKMMNSLGHDVHSYPEGFYPEFSSSGALS